MPRIVGFACVEGLRGFMRGVGQERLHRTEPQRDVFGA